MLCLIGVMVISTVRFLQSACGFSQNCIPIIELSSHAVIQNYLSSSDGAGARKKERQRQTRPRDDDGYWEPDLREPNPTFVSESTLNLFSVLLSFHHVSIFPSIPFSFTAHQCFFSWRETKQGCSLNAEVLPIISPYTYFFPFSFSVSHSLAFCYGRS